MSDRVDIVHWLRDLRHSPAVREIGDVGRGLHLAEDEIARLRAEVARLRLTDAEREALDTAIREGQRGGPLFTHTATLRGLLARHGGDK